MTRIYVQESEIVFTTINGLGNVDLDKKFDVVIIDECCQLKECESLIAFQNTKRVTQNIFYSVSKALKNSQGAPQNCSATLV